MFEHRSEKLLSSFEFFLRMLRGFGLIMLIVIPALFLGTYGYHKFGELEWIDAFANASMILSGMGPLNPIASTSGKLFAAFYALFSGIVFIAMMGIFMAPITHRLLHKFHMDDGD